MDLAEQFSGVITPKAPLASRTCFKVGGPADYLAQPSTREQLVAILRAAHDAQLPVRILGGGSNILVPDEGFHGVALELSSPKFCSIKMDKTRVTAGAGISLAELIASTCKLGLSGLEALVGIPGSLGGAICKNAGGRSGDIGQFIRSIDVVDFHGNLETRGRSEIRFGYRQSDLDDVIILSAVLDLLEDTPQNIVRRLKKIWIEKKAHQPFSFQNAGCAFRDPRGLSAADLIEKSGLRQTKVGGAELSDRDPRYVLAGPGATSRDIRQLIDLVVARVEEQTGMRLEIQLDLW